MEAKFKRVLIALVLLAVVLGAVFLYKETTKNKGSKEITVVITDIMGKELYNKTLTTDTETLGDLLKEMKQDGEIKLTYENDSKFGMYITGLGVDEIVKNTSDKFWNYTSENNKSCKAAEYCDGVSVLSIADKDEFIFTYGVAAF